MNTRKLLTCLCLVTATVGSKAQSALYPHHFDLKEVRLLDSTFLKAMELNNKVMLQYDVDRLLTPYIRQAGLTSSTEYQQWEEKHPSFPNWGSESFRLDGHILGDYISALALAYAANHDPSIQSEMKQRLDYILAVLTDCQNRFDNDAQGLCGYIGGQPINEIWIALYRGDIRPFMERGSWVPFWSQYKMLNGLRDAYLFTGDETAKTMFHKLSDWAVNVITRIDDAELETILGWEHGGMNESLLDAYQLYGDKRYLDAAYRYTHKKMLDGLQTLQPTFLDGMHANTQIPKYIGMERIGEVNAVQNYLRAADNFWIDVTENRTTCLGGNSVSEHFLAASSSHKYIDRLDGPETCNTYNMMKLAEMMSDRTHDARYADFYEYAMWNHILSSQDPDTGGYVYFTTLRPQGYRVYSQVNQGMWCCVGTGWQNHSKYGQFIYTHDAGKTLYVNLFTASVLNSPDFAVTQETRYPYEPQTSITIGKAGEYTIAIRHPWWTTDNYGVSINGVTQTISVTKGTASYVLLHRQWKVGDVITVSIPMELRYNECPGYNDFIAFEYGPILLGAATTSPSPETSNDTSLPYESLQNEYGGEGRMDHDPESRAVAKSLTDAPMLIGERNDVIERIRSTDMGNLQFTIDVSREDVADYQWRELVLKPFYKLHHSRYMCYWYQQTPEHFANSPMLAAELRNSQIRKMTIDFVAPGEQQSEAGHKAIYDSHSLVGNFQAERFRNVGMRGFLQYTLIDESRNDNAKALMVRFNTADKGKVLRLSLNGERLSAINVSDSNDADEKGFFYLKIDIPDAMENDKGLYSVRLEPDASNESPNLYEIRLVERLRQDFFSSSR